MVRCQLELSSLGRRPSCWVTLTYDEAHVPVTLRKDHLSGWVKRLRSRVGIRFRFFGCGEYGEQGGRPHYHVMLFGLSQKKHEADIVAAWGQGIVQVDRLEPAAVAYVCGYTTKKVGIVDKSEYAFGRFEELNRETGEVTAGVHRNIIYQAPFLLMSRNPGIGGDARTHWKSWRKSAVWDGKEVRVPRFLHDAFKANAPEEELYWLQAEKDAYLATVPVDSKLRERAGEAIALRKQSLTLQKRSKL